jgi:uncharacterized protein
MPQAPFAARQGARLRRKQGAVNTTFAASPRQRAATMFANQGAHSRGRRANIWVSGMQSRRRFQTAQAGGRNHSTAPLDLSDSSTREDPIMSMSNASIPVFEIGLNALSAILDKAETYAAARSIDPAMLLSARLFPDMFALAQQVQSACDQAKNGGARLADIDPPRYEDNEKTIAELKARIAKTVAFVTTLDAKKIDDSADREITFPLGPKNMGRMRGADYLNHFAVPNFYFHVTTAYDILRHCGVEIGKRDFLGTIPMRIT